MKLFEYLKSYVATSGFVFFRKRIHQLEMKRNGKINLGANSFFLTEKPIHADFNWLLCNQKNRSN